MQIVQNSKVTEQFIGKIVSFLPCFQQLNSLPLKKILLTVHTFEGFLNFLFYIGVQVINNVVLVSGVQQRIFRAAKLLCIMLQWWIHVTHLTKPPERTTPRVNPNINYGLWVIRICECRYINCNKCTILVGTAGAGEHRKSMYLPLNFAVNLKLL